MWIQVSSADNPANRCAARDVIEMKGNSASNTRSGEERSDHTTELLLAAFSPRLPRDHAVRLFGVCAFAGIRINMWRGAWVSKQARLKRICPGRVWSFDVHADGRSDYRRQTAVFHLSFNLSAGLGTGSDLSGERAGSHPEQLSVGDRNLTSDALSVRKFCTQLHMNSKINIFRKNNYTTRT